MSLKLRLLSIAAAPLLLLIGLAGVQTATSFTERERANDLVETIKSAEPLTALAYALQKERGASSTFVSSQGTAFLASLQAQRAGVDRALAAYNSSKKDIEQRFEKTSRVIDAAVGSLLIKRQQVSNKSVTTDEITSYYKPIIDAVIEGVSLSFTNHAGDDTRSDIAAYSALMLARESAGLERQTGAAGFAKGRLTPSEYEAFISLRAAQNANFAAAGRRLGDDTIAALLSGPEAAKLQALRSEARSLAGVGALAPVTADEWFSTATAFVDAIARVETSIAERLKTTARANASSATANLIFQAVMTLLGIAAGIAVAMLQAQSISNPLARINKAMRRIGAGDLDFRTPTAKVGGEIGEISDTVGKVRDSLSEARSAQKVQVFKGAAFDGSSTAMIMIDRERKIQFVNDATGHLVAEYLDEFRKAGATIDAENLLGQPLDRLYKLPQAQREALDDAVNLPLQADASIGDLRFTFSISAVLDTDGEYVGNIVEWDNVTVARTNEGMLAALDRTQAIAEMTLDGVITHANELFAKTLGMSVHDLVGKRHSELLDEHTASSDEHRALWEKVRSGAGQTSTMKHITRMGDPVWFQASITPILDMGGDPFKAVFYGIDVTAESVRAFDAEGQVEAIKRGQAVIEFDLDAKILAANQNFLDAMGYEASEVVGAKHALFLEEDYRNSSEYEKFWSDLRRGEAQYGEFRRISSAGEFVWLQATYNPIVGLDGRVYKVVETAHVITKQYEERTNAARLQAAVENSVSAIMTVDRDFVVNYVNGATKDLLRKHEAAFRQIWPNFSANEIIGTCIDTFHKDPSHQRRMLADPANLPHRTDIKVGELEFSLTVSAQYDLQGEYIGNTLEWADVTELRKQERLNADFRSKMEAIDKAQGVIEFDLKGNIRTANGNFLDVVGYTLDEIVGKHHRMFVSDDYARSNEYKEFWDTLGAGSYKSGEFERRAKDGSEVFIQASYNAIYDVDGNLTGIVKFATDVTQVVLEKRQIEEDRRRNAEEQEQVVNALTVNLRKLSEGDLTAQIDEHFAKDYQQLRLDFNAAVEKLHHVIKDVALNAATIHTNASEVTQAADDLSRRTETQAATLEETAASLDEVTATVKQTANGAQEANTVVATTRKDAEASEVVVRQAVDAMSSIEQSSDQISQIIGVIDEIAFQTNLLALNAGVEAARAGDAGRGFAVVASEVRALAQRSSDAAKEIKDLISTSTHHVENGVSLVGQAGQALEQILSQIKNVSTIVSDITTAAKEQATGLTEINSAMNQMDQVTQQNAAMVEESTAAAHSLNNEANQLMQSITVFKTKGSDTQVRSPVVSSQPGKTESVEGQQKRVAAFVASGGAQAAEQWEEF
ncbi:MAG: methyl-accepting chemotaxis protein [Pseudomonadota bacterium]